MANGKTKSELSSWGWSNFIAVIILAVILILGGSALGNSALKKQAQKSVAGTESIFNPVVEKTINYEGQDGKNALELLKSNHKVETQESSFGIFITSIDGTANQDNKYWMFYVNDQLASNSADQYETKNGDKIEWRYESLQ